MPQTDKEIPHIENIDSSDLSLLIMPNMLREHQMRYELMAKVLNELSDGENRNKTIVDMGSARGMGTKILGTELGNAKIIGLEIGWQYVEKAKEKNKRDGMSLNYAQADVVHAPLPSSCADGIAMFEILEHVPQEDQPKLLSEAFRLVKKDGLVMVSIPFPYSFDESGKRIGASSNPFHLHEPSTQELIDLATNTGFEVVKRYGQSFATKKGINIAKILERELDTLKIPAWTMYGINMNGIRNPKPTAMSIGDEMTQKIPLTQIFILRKPQQ